MRGRPEVASKWKSGELPLFVKSLRPGTQVKTYRTWSAAQYGRNANGPNRLAEIPLR